MSTKLTLSIDRSVIEDAKAYAKSSGRSLSGLVEEYLKSLAGSDAGDKKQKSLKMVRELKGAVKMPKDFSSYQALLEDALIEKYLGR